MKINDTQRIGAINSYKNQNQSGLNASGKKGKRKDEVQISSEAQELLSTYRAGSQDQEVRNRKLEELKNSINTGTYHRDARLIAEKLLPYMNK